MGFLGPPVHRHFSLNPPPSAPQDLHALLRYVRRRHLDGDVAVSPTDVRLAAPTPPAAPRPHTVGHRPHRWAPHHGGVHSHSAFSFIIYHIIYHIVYYIVYYIVYSI